MEYHIGDSIAIGSGGLEFKDKENPQVELYADRMSRMSGTENNDSDMELLDEAGNIRSGLALKFLNLCYTHLIRTLSDLDGIGSLR